MSKINQYIFTKEHRMFVASLSRKNQVHFHELPYFFTFLMMHFATVSEHLFCNCLPNEEQYYFRRMHENVPSFKMTYFGNAFV